jgi:hypothetical protein
MTTKSASAIRTFCIYDGQTYLGRVVLHGKAGVEAFDIDDCVIGVFPSQQQAADAVAAYALQHKSHA